MHRVHRRWPARPSSARTLVGALLAIAVVIGLATTAQPATAAGPSPWDGGIDLYRSGVFTTQQTWQWCTAADVQIIRNIVDRDADHSRSNQERYFKAMRAHNRYHIPVADGVDPAGWTYGLRHFVDTRYRLVASSSFDGALRSAVTSLRPSGARMHSRYSGVFGICCTLGSMQAKRPEGAPIWMKLGWTRPVTGWMRSRSARP